MRRLLLLPVVCLFAALLWSAGFVWFCVDALHPAPQAMPCDGIVALTGGKDRVETSFALFAHGLGNRLLISGVDPHVTLDALADHASVRITPDMARRITLGRRAVSTIGNGAETAEWAARNHIRSLLVVTAGYHIRRAMIELHRAAPNVILHPYPVTPPVLRRALDRNSIHLLLSEYTKWIGSQLGLSRGINLTPKS